MKTENDNKNLNVPNLRFPEFDGEWEKVTLGKTCNVLMCKRILASQTNAESGVPFYKIGTIGGVPDAYISKELFDMYKAKYNYPKKGEVMITCAGTVGKTMIFDGNDAYYQDSNIVWIDNPTNNIDNSFLYHYLSQIDWSKLNTTTIVRIYNDDLRQLKISYPSTEEQKKISHLLNLVNQRIATQIKIIEKLESLIKGLCQKLTRQGNPNTILNNCLECYSSTLQESSVLKFGNFPVYGATGVCGYTDMPEVNGDSILIIKDGASVGATYYASGEYSAIGTLNRLVAKNGYSLRYLYYCFKVFNFAPYRTGLAIPHIYFRDYGKTQIYCPPIEEQSRIAKALEKVEQKIATEKSLLEHLYSQKRFLLHAMFI